MAKLKIVRREAEAAAAARSAQPGSGRTGAKVEKVKAGKGKPGESAGRFIGRTSGLGVSKYQNQSILGNMKRRLTDEQLAAEWRREFPNAQADYTAETVRSVRNLVNKGTHGNEAPKVKVPQFDESGNALPFWGEKAEAAAAAKSGNKTAAKTIKKIAKQEKKRAK